MRPWLQAELVRMGNFAKSLPWTMPRRVAATCSTASNCCLKIRRKSSASSFCVNLPRTAVMCSALNYCKSVRWIRGMNGAIFISRLQLDRLECCRCGLATTRPIREMRRRWWWCYRLARPETNLESSSTPCCAATISRSRRRLLKKRPSATTCRRLWWTRQGWGRRCCNWYRAFSRLLSGCNTRCKKSI